MQIYIINLERAPDRLRGITEEFSKYGLSFERIDAYDAKKHSSSETQSNRLPEGRRHYWLMELTDGEIACYLSHKKAWKQLVESSEEWALVAEDDVKFEADPRGILGDLSWIPNGVELVQLAHEFPGRHVKYVDPVVRVDSEHIAACLMDYRHSGGGTQGYLINRRLAAMLLEEFPLIEAPIDDMLFYHASPIRRFTRPFFMCPGLIGSNDGGFSYLQAEKSKIKCHVSHYPMRYIRRKFIKLMHDFKCKFVYKDMIR